MHTQNLRDSTYEKSAFFSHWRGWFKKWRWEYSISKHPLSEVARFNVTLGGEDPCQVSLSVGLLGASVYLTFHDVLPEKWAIGWFERDGVRNPNRHEDSHGRQWGFYLTSEVFHVNVASTVAASGSPKHSKENIRKYGRSYHFWMPWNWENVQWDVKTTDGTWNTISHEQRNAAFRKARKLNKDLNPFEVKDEDYPDYRKIYEAHYVYTMKNGRVQDRTATFYVDRMEWRWRIFSNLPFKFGPKKVREGICITFSDEVGEGTGSWKGGTTGCSYTMKPRESPMNCLRRMEAERKF